jgi:putative serine protease PepD
MSESHPENTPTEPIAGSGGSWWSPTEGPARGEKADIPADSSPDPVPDRVPDPVPDPDPNTLIFGPGPAPTTGAEHYGSPPPAPRSATPRPAWRVRTGIAVLVAAVALGSGLAGAVLATQFDHSTTVTTTAAPVNVSGAASSTPTERLAKVAAAVQPSVVSITVSASSGSDEGSGVVLRSDGTILTNNHVIAAAADGGTINVRFSSGHTASATIVGRDPTTDLAVLKAKGVSGMTPATLGSAASVHVGDTVLASGSPLGLEGSVTAGIVSALHRTVQLSDSQDQNGPLGQQQSTQSSVGDAIQTDASINPGNSGGPLVDDSGRVIGINTAIASLGSGVSGQSGSIGVGFAIPIDEAKNIAEQLIAGKTPVHAVLGVQITDDASGGALVGAVTSGGAAAAAGLKAGDVIKRIDGTTISDAADLTAAVRGHQPKDTITVRYSRNGADRTATVTLGGSGG